MAAKMTTLVGVYTAASLLVSQFFRRPWFLEAAVWGKPGKEYIVVRVKSTTFPETNIFRTGWLGHKVVLARVGKLERQLS